MVTKRLTKADRRAVLLKLLADAADLATWDTERAHIHADAALLGYIDDPEVTEAFQNIHKWYT